MRPLVTIGREEATRLEGVLFDLDDTLLTHGALSPEAYRALFELGDAGLVLVAVTGRPAGWAEVFARQWPIEGCVAENGAIAVVREGPTIRVVDPVAPSVRRARRDALADLVRTAAREIPEIAISDDTHARTSDVAWDVGESARASEPAIARLVALCEAAGARTSRSSVHVHASLDVCDKATGVLSFLHARLAVDPTVARGRFAYVGDSGNDAPCFAAFTTSIGVANVWMSRRKMAILPAWVTASERGAGFAEMARTLARLRRPLDGPGEPRHPPRMATQDDLLADAHRYLYPNYKPAPFVLARGKGCEIFDVGGRRYLDFAAGVAVCSVGHAHPDHVRAIAEQAATLVHTSNYFYNEPNIRLARRLCERSGMARAFFCNSGTEAVEALFKLTRRHFHAKGDAARRRFLAFDNAFHGRSMGALSLTGTPKYREGFGVIEGVAHVPYGDLDAVRRHVGPELAAIVVEPIQGEGGVLPPPPGFLASLRALSDANGSLLLFDEVQTGVGRTGSLFGFQQAGVVPDALSLAKGLGGGVPIGVMLTSEALAGALPPGTHGSTFGGNPLASAAALSVLDILDREGLVEGARVKGEILHGLLVDLVRDLPDVCEGARGAGLLRALVLRPGRVARDELVDLAAAGLLLTAAGDRVLRFTPPLVVTDREIVEGVGIVRDVLLRSRAG